MKKVQRNTNFLFLMFSPEDSSSWDAGTMEICSSDQDKMRKILSMLKFLTWYAIAIAMSIFLSSFH